MIRLPLRAAHRPIVGSENVVDIGQAAFDAQDPLSTFARSPELRLENIDVKFNREARTYWASMRPDVRPIFTMNLLNDMKRMQHSIAEVFAMKNGEARQPIEYVVFGSRTPGIYNLGGDLAHFAESILAGDRESMQAYAYACIDVIYGNAMAFNTPVITMALVQGDALGGGFECALSFDLIVAERSAKMGLPEVLFNLFPGMGAYSFLSRKIGSAAAEKMIMSGKIYTAGELHAMGVVDVLTEDGEGEIAVQDYIERNSRKHNAHTAIYRARRRVNPVTYEELRDVVDIWVDAALNLTEPDLRKMARLTSAQDRRMATALAPYAVAAE